MALVDCSQIKIMDNIAIDRKKGSRPKTALRQTQAAPGSQFQIFHLDVDILLAVKHGPNLLPEMMGIDHDFLGSASAKLAQGMGQKGSIKHREKGLGPDQGIGAQAGSEARGQNHGFHEVYNPAGWLSATKEAFAKFLFVVRQGSPELAEGLNTNGKNQ